MILYDKPIKHGIVKTIQGNLVGKISKTGNGGGGVGMETMDGR